MSLHVWLHDERVGTLRVEQTDWLRLDVSEEYWEQDPRPVIGQALEQDRGRRVTRSHLTLPPMLSNLLPEGELRRLIAEHHGIDPRRELPLLARLGEDLAGALCFTRGDDVRSPPAPLSEVSDDEAWAFSSLAGVQPKFTTERTRKGFVLAAKGRGERWIVKVPDGRFERVPETEALVTEWARGVGITTVESHLVRREDIQGLPGWAASREEICFASKRYDRDATARVHQEDFCQVFNVSASQRYAAATYDRLARTVLECCGADDARELIRRLAFMVTSGNTDLHLKNWSLYYPDRVQPRLAPAYDLLSTIPFIPKQTTALSLAREKRLSALSLSHFAQLATRLEPIRAEVEGIVRETVSRAVTLWREDLHARMVPAYVDAIERLHHESSLVREIVGARSLPQRPTPR